MYDRIEFIDNPDVKEIGVDDVAIRKGQTYATAIYDLKDHHLIALLDGRDGVPLKEWLKSHKKVRLVARDSASAYASAINEVLPECIQVADRFHLLQNLLEIYEKTPEKILKERTPGFTFLDSLHYDNTPPVDCNGNEVIYDNKKYDLDSPQYQHQKEIREKTTTNSEDTGLLEKDEEKLDEYLRKYIESEIQSFCNGIIKKDILPVKNAISFSISSGFVEGNNNKFKVLKRIVYGRSGLANLEKCKLAFIQLIPANTSLCYTQSSERTFSQTSAFFFSTDMVFFHITPERGGADSQLLSHLAPVPLVFYKGLPYILNPSLL